MSIFEKHDHTPTRAEFMGLALDAGVLTTPAGPMPIEALTQAEFLRTFAESAPGPGETSVPAVIGGAVVGGVVFGAAGAVVGGVLGSTVKEEGQAKPRQSSAHLSFATDELNYSMDVPRDQEGAAYTFSETVKKAMKQH
jgi:hypothetical protein